MRQSEDPGDSAPRLRSSAAWLAFGLAVLLAAYPSVVMGALEGLRGAFRGLAPDSFYYLAIAQHSRDAAFFSFDGSHPTNGFHPLWQWLLSGAVTGLNLSSSGILRFATAASTAFTAIGIGLVVFVLARETRRPLIALFGSVPGLYYLMLPSFNRDHGAIWSAANGMESPLSILLFGLLLAMLSRRAAALSAGESRTLLVLSLLLTALTLARLDDIFLFAPFIAHQLWRAASSRERGRRLAWLCLLPTLVIGAYLLNNLSYAGTALPSSGSAKATGLWALARNGYALITTLAPFVDLFGRGRAAWGPEAWRVAQMAVPAAVALAWCATRRAALLERAEGAPLTFDGVLGLVGVYVLIKAGYNFGIVSLWGQGPWYYPLSVITCNVMLTVWLARGLDRAKIASVPVLLATAGQRRAGLALSAALLVLLVVSGNTFIDSKTHSRHQGQRRNWEFWSNRAQTGAQVRAECGSCGVLSYDDGIVSFSLPEIYTLNGMGLALDREAATAQREGRLVELAWQRGVRLLVSVNYQMSPDYSSPLRLAPVGQNAQRDDQAPKKWHFEPAFRSADGAQFVRISPVDPAARRSTK